VLIAPRWRDAIYILATGLIVGVAIALRFKSVFERLASYFGG
jgi:hypothetical protein